MHSFVFLSTLFITIKHAFLHYFFSNQIFGIFKINISQPSNITYIINFTLENMVKVTFGFPNVYVILTLFIALSCNFTFLLICVNMRSLAETGFLVSIGNPRSSYGMFDLKPFLIPTAFFLSISRLIWSSSMQLTSCLF